MIINNLNSAKIHEPDFTELPPNWCPFTIPKTGKGKGTLNEAKGNFRSSEQLLRRTEVIIISRKLGPGKLFALVISSHQGKLN